MTDFGYHDRQAFLRRERPSLGDTAVGYALAVIGPAALALVLMIASGRYE